jgi:hypothetical protein
MRTLVVLMLVAGCQSFGSGERGSGTPKTEQRTVPAFSKVLLEGSLQADITAGGTQLVEISGDDNIVPLIVTEVTGDRLRVAPKKNIAPKLELTARIATPTLSAIAVSGSAKVAVRGLTGDAFAIDTSGSTRVTASGTSKRLEIHVSGSSTIDATQVRAENVTVDVSGSANVDVYATGVLDVRIAGSARVRYAGSPREVHKDISGSGTLEPR